MVPKNNLRQIRLKEGLRVTELAGFSKVSTKSIDRIEECKKPVSYVTKSKVVKGLNKNPDRLQLYKFLDVFPVDGKK